MCRVGSKEQPRGPIKASYGLPEEQWQVLDQTMNCKMKCTLFAQVRYQYRSPQKIQGESDSVEKQLRRGRIQGGARGSFGREGRGASKDRQLEATSDYGTMSRQSQMMMNNEWEQLFNIAKVNMKVQYLFPDPDLIVV